VGPKFKEMVELQGNESEIKEIAGISASRE